MQSLQEKRIQSQRGLIKNKMVEYRCFGCDKKIPDNIVRKKIRCPYCGSKILFKPREKITKVKAR